MATSHFYYNGQQLDTYDGTKGIIISAFTHEPSSDVEYSASPLSRGNGQVFHQARPRSKSIRVAGTVVGTDKQDFEQRLDTLKALLAATQGQLTVTNYGTLEYRVACFEEGEAWSRSYINAASVDDAPLWDFTNYKIGTRGLTIEASSGSGAKSASWAATHDLSAFADTDSVKLWVDIPDATKLTSIRLRFETTAGSAYYSNTWSSGFSNGSNELSAIRSAFSSTGSPSWASIANIQLTVTGSNATAATITFDDLRFVTTAESRTYNASISSPLDIPREHFHVDWCDFSVTFTVADGTAESSHGGWVTTPDNITAQQHLPLYLSGSGEQPLTLSADIGTSRPEAITLYDHYADEFSSYVNRYVTNIATFESIETWTGGAADSVNVRIGARAIKLTATASTTVNARMTFGAAKDYSALANTENATPLLYVDTAANLASITIRFYTTYATDYYEQTYSTAMSNGWNAVALKKRTFTATGTPNWNSIATVEIEATANGSGTVNVSFDHLDWINSLGATGGLLSSASGVTVAPNTAYRTALIAPVGGTLLRTNAPFRDGEVVALVRIPTGSYVNLYGRYETATTNVRGVTLANASDSTASLADTEVLNVGNFVSSVVDPTRWFWVRLVVQGRAARLYQRNISSDAWTLVAEGATGVLNSGKWGIGFQGAGSCAHVEIIDYATGQSNALRLSGGPFGTTAQDGLLMVDTGVGTMREGSRSGRFSGSLPVLKEKLNELAVIHPAASIGSSNFYYPESKISAWYTFGGTSTDKVAIPFTTGSNTYIRRRGTFIYLAKIAASPPIGSFQFSIQTDSAGAPSGTPVVVLAQDTMAPADVPAFITSGSDTYNGSIVPIELKWPVEDVPLSASTTYWLVIDPSSEAGDYWAVPYQADTGANRLYEYNGAAWALVTGSAKTAFAIFAGNYPNATVSTPWQVTTDYTPSYL